ncbi:hypothetical protein ERJ75_001426700 [Trypanosoma vivax]|nr:hypothetical protein TRVL_08381 [Trypanosoma vivax]KAH8606846.1 hypothetical protein ERJ75_001426700 [Trypanosoma vivax]
MKRSPFLWDSSPSRAFGYDAGKMRYPAQSGTSTALSFDVTDSEYKRMAHELTLLSPDEFCRRIYRFSRTNFDPSQKMAVHAHITELINRRIQEVSFKHVREYAHLAHVAGLHDLCLATYYAKANLMSSATPTSGGGDLEGSFAVSDSVVDSAYRLRSSENLLRLATYCVKHLQHVPSLGWEVMSSFSLLRTFWRCICISVSSDGMHSEESKQSLVNAASIYEKCIALIYPIPSQSISTQRIINTTTRFVRYASCGDEGEMLFYRFCHRHGFLRKTRDSLREKHQEGVGNASSVYGSDGNSGPGEGGSVTEGQWLYASLIATCRVGHHVHEALHYFDEIGSQLGVEQVSCSELLRPRPTQLPWADDNAKRTKVTRPDVSNTMEGMSEYLIFQLLTVLHAAKENRKIVFTARAMLRDGAKLSISVWSIVLIAAGETRAVDLALAAFAQAKLMLQESTQSGNQSGNEYLLQTSILALSKCQLPRFEEEYLVPCREQLLTHSSEEFFHCALLQHAHNSTNPEAGTEQTLKGIREGRITPTTRIVSRLMKIYLRTESPDLLGLYKEAKQKFGLFKLSWLDELLLWADRRRYTLTSEERKYILDEVQRVYGARAVEGDLGGLRTQLALLRYDYEHTPRELFLTTARLPEVEPTTMDSRAHFLVKKPRCINHHKVVRKIHAICAYSSESYRLGGGTKSTASTNLVRGTVTASGRVCEMDFRLYMGKMLRSLQKTNNCAR